MTGHWESKEQEDYFMELERQKQERDEAEQRNYEYALEMQVVGDNRMNPQQAAHYRTLAAAHKDTPGDLAQAYRVIGELLDENKQLQNFKDQIKYAARNHMAMSAERFSRDVHKIIKDAS